MEYCRLGQCGLKVSELCLGTMTFGRGADAAEAAEITGLCLDAGVNFIDTANTYADSASETMLGHILDTKRRQVVLASKFFNPVGPGPNDSGTSRVHIMNAVEDSLRRLRTDYLDIYYVHHVDVETPLDEMLRAVDDLIRQGKVRYIGCSNYEAWRLMEAVWISDTRNLSRFVCYQGQHSLLVRDIEEEVVPACELKRLGVVAWSPLAGGLLTGKYRPGEPAPPGTRTAEGWGMPSRYVAANYDEVLTTLIDAAKDLGRLPAELALRWSLDQPFMTSAIVGARTSAQVKQSLKAVDWHLPDELRAKLDNVSAAPHRFPRATAEEMIERRRSAVAVGQLAAG